MRVVEREPPARGARSRRATGAPRGRRAAARASRADVWGVPGARPPALAHPVRRPGRAARRRARRRAGVGARQAGASSAARPTRCVVRGEVVEREVVELAGEGERRVLVLAVVVVRGERWTVGTTHLALRPGRRRASSSARRCTSLITRPGPWVLAGDLNLEPPDVAPIADRARLRPARRPAHPLRAPRPRRAASTTSSRRAARSTASGVDEAAGERPPGGLGRPVTCATSRRARRPRNSYLRSASPRA